MPPVAAAVGEALALLAQRLKRFDVFFDRMRRIVTVQQEHVHVVGAEDLQRLVDLLADALGRHDLLRAVAEHVAALREEDDPVAVAGRRLEPARDRFLGPRISARRVDGVEARVHGGGDERVRVAALQHHGNRRPEEHAVRRLVDALDGNCSADHLTDLLSCFMIHSHLLDSAQYSTLFRALLRLGTLRCGAWCNRRGRARAANRRSPSSSV